MICVCFFVPINHQLEPTLDNRYSNLKLGSQNMARNWSYIKVCTWWNPCKLVLQTPFFLCCITTRMSYSSCTFKIYVGLRTNYKLVKEDNTPHSTCTCCMILPDSQLKGAYDIVSQNAGKILDNKISLWAQTNVSCSKTPKGTRTSPPPPHSTYTIPRAVLLISTTAMAMSWNVLAVVFIKQTNGNYYTLPWHLKTWHMLHYRMSVPYARHIALFCYILPLPCS